MARPSTCPSFISKPNWTQFFLRRPWRLTAVYSGLSVGVPTATRCWRCCFPVQLPASKSTMAICSDGQLSANPFIRKGKLDLTSTFLQEVRRGSSGHNRGSSISTVVPIMQFGGPRLTIIGRSGQAWQIRSISFASLCPLFLRQTQVCAPFLSSLLLL